MFQGIFYHLSDPITGLKAATDLTSELLILDTAVLVGAPDGMLALAEESPTPLMSAVYGLNWFPTGLWCSSGSYGGSDSSRPSSSIGESTAPAGGATWAAFASSRRAQRVCSQRWTSRRSRSAKTPDRLTSTKRTLEPISIHQEVARGRPTLNPSSKALAETDRALRRLLRYLKHANPEPGEELDLDMRRAKCPLRANNELLGDPSATTDGPALHD